MNDLLLDTNILIYMLEGNIAVRNAQNYRLKLADSIILASAQTFDIPLLTADIQFRKVDGPDQDVLIFRP